MTEDQVRTSLRAFNFTLLRREDGFYDIADDDGDQVALLDWTVEEDVRNDRGREIGSAYPLTLDEIARAIA
jgi:hypothetical protein